MELSTAQCCTTENENIVALCTDNEFTNIFCSTQLSNREYDTASCNQICPVCQEWTHFSKWFVRKNSSIAAPSWRENLPALDFSLTIICCWSVICSVTELEVAAGHIHLILSPLAHKCGGCIGKDLSCFCLGATSLLECPHERLVLKAFGEVPCWIAFCSQIRIFPCLAAAYYAEFVTALKDPVGFKILCSGTFMQQGFFLSLILQYHCIRQYHLHLT